MGLVGAQPRNIYLGQTERVERPTRASHPRHRPDELAQLQADWDAAREWHLENQRLREERHAAVDAKQAAERERVAKRQEEEALARQAEIERDLRARFLAEGGTVKQWQQVKDELVLDYLKRATLGGADPARARNRMRYG